jgi:hypothetical protein
MEIQDRTRQGMVHFEMGVIMNDNLKWTYRHYDMIHNENFSQEMMVDVSENEIYIPEIEGSLIKNSPIWMMGNWYFDSEETLVLFLLKYS